MDNEKRRIKSQELNSKINIKIEQRKLLELEITSLRKELFETEWIKFTWDELENWLKENRPENNYEDNPIVTDVNNYHIEYCFINKDGKLQIGAWENNDRFPRSRDLYVRYDFKKYR